jgi:hypothetical protein
LYLEHKYEQLEAYFDIQCIDVLIGSRPSFECKFFGNWFKDKNTLSYQKITNSCLDYTGGELFKIYPMMTKAELKEFNNLREKFGKTLPN